LVNFLYVDIMADVGGEAVVLLFLEGGVVERMGRDGELLGEGLEEKIDEGGVVEDAVEIGAHTARGEEVAVFPAIVEEGEGRGLGAGNGGGLAVVDFVGFAFTERRPARNGGGAAFLSAACLVVLCRPLLR
jgi:hypothetical protein